MMPNTIQDLLAHDVANPRFVSYILAYNSCIVAQETSSQVNGKVSLVAYVHTFR